MKLRPPIASIPNRDSAWANGPSMSRRQTRPGGSSKAELNGSRLLRVWRQYSRTIHELKAHWHKRTQQDRHPRSHLDLGEFLHGGGQLHDFRTIDLNPRWPSRMGVPKSVAVEF